MDRRLSIFFVKVAQTISNSVCFVANTLNKMIYAQKRAWEEKSSVIGVTLLIREPVGAHIQK